MCARAVCPRAFAHAWYGMRVWVLRTSGRLLPLPPTTPYTLSLIPYPVQYEKDLSIVQRLPAFAVLCSSPTGLKELGNFMQYLTDRKKVGEG